MLAPEKATKGIKVDGKINCTEMKSKFFDEYECKHQPPQSV